MACVCLAALLLAASVEAGHVCGALQSPRAIPAGASRLETPAAYCPICALAQPATAGKTQVTLAPSMSVTATTPVPEAQPYSFHGLFELKVRPPPA